MNRMINCLILSLLVLSCEKSKNDDANKNDLIFGGITNTTIEGVVTSIDTTDWKLSEPWIAKEISLFDIQYENQCNTDNNDYSIFSYPNPCDGIFIIDISKPEESLFAFRVVDKKFNVLMAKDSITSTIAVDLNDYGIMNNDTVRIYYKIFAQDCEYKGHGDIKIEK